MKENKDRLIRAESLFRFLNDQRVKETGAFSKGHNKGINIARGAVRNEEICPTVDAVPADGELGLMLNFAVRYACGRRTYAPSAVVNFITPLIPHLNDATLATLDQDLTEAQYEGGYVDPKLDEPLWKELHALVRQERNRRGSELYKSWRG